MGRPKKLTPQDTTSYKNQYRAENYDRLYPFVPKGKKDYYREVASKAGMSLNEFMERAMDELATKLEAETQ